jgi:hypothetical protein
MSDCPGGQEAGYQVECWGECCCFLTGLELTSIGNSILHLVRMSIAWVTSHSSRFRETHMATGSVLAILSLVIGPRNGVYIQF